MNRNKVEPSVMVAYVIGLILIAVGWNFATTTQINLATGATTNPRLAVGVAMLLAGVVVVVVANRRARQNLRK